MDTAAEIGMNPVVSKHQIQPECGDEKADAGRDCRTLLARIISQARTVTGKYFFPCSADHEEDWQPYPVDPYSASCDHHTNIPFSPCMESKSYFFPFRVMFFLPCDHGLDFFLHQLIYVRIQSK